MGWLLQGRRRSWVSTGAEGRQWGPTDVYHDDEVEDVGREVDFPVTRARSPMLLYVVCLVYVAMVSMSVLVYFHRFRFAMHRLGFRICSRART